jgi:hypothetical protein
MPCTPTRTFEFESAPKFNLCRAQNIASIQRIKQIQKKLAATVITRTPRVTSASCRLPRGGERAGSIVRTGRAWLVLRDPVRREVETIRSEHGGEADAGSASAATRQERHV